jgi:hypothetical protein
MGDIGLTQEDAAALLTLSPGELFQRGALEIAKDWNQYGFKFLPLVTKKVCLRCSLDILFLRAEERNYVLQGGDIDRRLTVLFDALRIALKRVNFRREPSQRKAKIHFFAYWRMMI